MKTVIMNNELTLTFPDGFENMSAEKEAAYKIAAGRGEGEVVEDTGRHMVVSCAWKQVGILSSLLLNSKDLAKNAGKAMIRAMRDFRAQSDGLFSENVGGKRMEGVRYHYTVQNIDMSAETLTLKQEKTFYYLHFYFRTEYKEESLKTIGEILKTAEWN